MDPLAFSFGHFWSRRLISVFAFCFFRWVVFGTIFGEERYCEAFPGDYDKGKNKGAGGGLLYSIPGIWNWDGLLGELDRGARASG